MHPFKLHNLVVFSIFTYKVVRPSPPVPEHSSPQKETPYTTIVTPRAIVLATTDQWTASVDVPILAVLYKWNICDLLCLASFT